MAGGTSERSVTLCACACVRVCARACVPAHVCVCVCARMGVRVYVCVYRLEMNGRRHIRERSNVGFNTASPFGRFYRVLETEIAAARFETRRWNCTLQYVLQCVLQCAL